MQSSKRGFGELVGSIVGESVKCGGEACLYLRSELKERTLDGGNASKSLFRLEGLLRPLRILGLRGCCWSGGRELGQSEFHERAAEGGQPLLEVAPRARGIVKAFDLRWRERVWCSVDLL